jgi:hypothetical protein
MMKSILSFFCFYLFFGQNASAQFHIYAQFDRQEALIGDRVGLNLVLDWDQAVDWDYPNWFLLGDEYYKQVVGIRLGKDTLKSGSLSKEIIIDMQFFDEGFIETDSLPISYTFAGEDRVIYIPPAGIRIRLLPDPDTLMPIKDIIREPVKWYDQWLFLLLALLILLGLVYFMTRGKRQIAPLEEKETGDIPSFALAHEIALEELDKLESERLWEKGKVQEFQIQLTSIVRRYIQNRFGVSALEMTTDQILKTLSIQIEKDQKRQLESILTIADLVKFAKYQPMEELHLEFIRKARMFFRNTANNRSKL